jgi:hypothetical protein
MSEEKVEYETRVTQLSIGVKGERLYNELGYTIEIMDDGELAEYVELSANHGEAKISIDAASWPALRDAIERLLKECREDAN